MRQEILEPNEAERKWIEANLRIARTAIKTFAPDRGPDITLPGLDAAYASWLAQHDPAKEDPNPFINAFGIAFGQHFVDELGFSWAVVKEGENAEMAVHRASKGLAGDSFIYPPNFVAKRYTSKATDFFERTFQQMRRDIEHPPASPTKKPWWKAWSKE